MTLAARPRTQQREREGERETSAVEGLDQQKKLSRLNLRQLDQRLVAQKGPAGRPSKANHRAEHGLHRFAFWALCVIRIELLGPEMKARRHSRFVFVLFFLAPADDDKRPIDHDDPAPPRALLVSHGKTKQT